MPFCLVYAPTTFSRLMHRVLRNTQNTDNYLNDVLAHTPFSRTPSFLRMYPES